jgi:hypothetical protein
VLWTGCARPQHPAPHFIVKSKLTEKGGCCISALMRPNLSDMILQTNDGLNPLKRAILLSVAYADVFDYPVTAREIHRYCGMKVPFTTLYAELQAFGFLSQSGDFYTLPGRESLAAVRAHREEISSDLWPHALRYGRAIAGLPFTRMVAVTGSLAVNNAESRADIDYFIVAEPGHLWTCRALVLALGRLAAYQGLNLCPNYLVTTRALEFHDQNLYVAHELAQMVPLSGLDIYADIRRRNAWVAEFLPNADGAPSLPATIKTTHFAHRLRPAFEAVLRTPPGTWFERWEMDRKVRRLSREQGDSDESFFSADVCKGHDQHHLTRTRRLLDSKVSRLLKQQNQPAPVVGPGEILHSIPPSRRGGPG